LQVSIVPRGTHAKRSELPLGSMLGGQLSAGIALAEASNRLPTKIVRIPDLGMRLSA